MNVYWYDGYSIVEEDFVGQIDDGFINKVINTFLKRKGLITKDIRRCVRKDNYLVTCPYGPLSYKNLSSLMKRVVNGFGIDYDFHYDLPDKVKEKLKDILPVSIKHQGSIASGVTEDSREIDPGVAPLVDAINTFDGAVTFSSCEGHAPSNNLYVLFHCEKMENLNKIAFYFDKYISELWNKYDLYTTDVDINFYFDYGKWKHMPKVFFEYRITYNNMVKKQILELVEELSCLVKEAVLKEIYVKA